MKGSLKELQCHPTVTDSPLVSQSKGAFPSKNNSTDNFSEDGKKEEREREWSTKQKRTYKAALPLFNWQTLLSSCPSSPALSLFAVSFYLDTSLRFPLR
ncbi:hypothetical protein HPP92_023809 [Vanilla planifolia]|uniref:Uncharacterized protein n=1 Tax=Vanilla planifolia TaxID=51239 RepID=A0A835PRJ4_VANPL|nr:hypothetical protein HPP92_024179 [Vanilla planifolia]KAG0456021.1 hypothetical protein HPP92_023809 [Vanilla planifolia]